MNLVNCGGCPKKQIILPTALCINVGLLSLIFLTEMGAKPFKLFSMVSLPYWVRAIFVIAIAAITIWHIWRGRFDA